MRGSPERRHRPRRNQNHVDVAGEERRRSGALHAQFLRKRYCAGLGAVPDGRQEMPSGHIPRHVSSHGAETDKTRPNVLLGFGVQCRLLLEVGVISQAGNQFALEALALFGGDTSLDQLLAIGALQIFRIDVYVAQEVMGAVAAHGLNETVAASAVEFDVDRMRVAEQIVHVAQDFLIGANQKNAD